MINKYRSSAQRLASWFLDSRNNWKQRALNKQKELRKAGIKIRDLQKSREDWKTKTKECLAKIKQLEEEIELIKKKEISIEAKPKNYSYSLRTISISLQQIIISGNSLRAVEKNWQIEKSENQEANEEKGAKVPSYSVIRQWLAKIGLYELQREKEKKRKEMIGCGLWI